jgi:DNA adenine methylase
LPLIPTTRIYVEPFGGGGSVLLNRPRSEIEVYNDLDRELVNLFATVRDRQLFAEFRRQVALMPYARAEFERCLDLDGAGDDISRAVRFYTLLNQSVSGKRLASRGDWSRNRTVNNADAWFRRQDTLSAVADRVRSVQVECRDGLDVIREWDTADTTFYLDPPYVLETRGQNKYYAVEPGDDFHARLVGVLLAAEGAVVLSGYAHPLYYPLLRAGWCTDSYGQATTMDLAESFKGTTRARVEVVYRNRVAYDRSIQRPLFVYNGHV